MEYHQVIIAGAGMAGLGAATTLHQNDCHDFLILEAKSEVGGRIKTISVNDKRLDIGAQWLHGKHNPLYKIAYKHGLLSDETSEEGLGIFVRNDGVIFDEYLVKVVDFKIGQILEKCAEFTREDNFPESVGTFLKKEFNKYLEECQDPSDIKQMKLELLDWHIRFQVVDNSCRHLGRLSARSWGDYVCIEDIAHFNLKNGYQSLIDVIVNSLPDDSIKCETEVTKIEYDNKTSGKIILSTRDNCKKFVCDHLILTFSLGVLKEFHSRNIFPALPKSITASINDMGFDGICKIYLFFEEKWWNDAKAFQLIWRQDENFEATNDKWVRNLTGFDEVFGHPSALISWVGGDGVEEVENMSEKEVGEKCVAVLRRFLPQFDVPKPTTVIRTRWLSDPYIKGSYCHITPECDRSRSGIHRLSEPVLVDGVPKILLAGEAMHPSHYSTTHGAFESGQQQAEVCLNFMKKSVAS